MATPTGLLAQAEALRLTAVERLHQRPELGQFFTPAPVARLMASLLDVTGEPCRMLDPGAGSGILTAAAAERWLEQGGGPLDITAVESEPLLTEPLGKTLAGVRALQGITGTHVPENFLTWAANRCRDDLFTCRSEPFDIAILNPPYRKISTNSAERAVLATQGVDVSNLYAAFVALAVRLLAPGGQLVAITPRSWANGPYFRSFRTDLLDLAALTHVHVYETRNTAFADGDVLQENVIYRVVRAAEQGPVVLSVSHSPSDQPVMRTASFHEVVHDDDRDRFVHLTLTAQSTEVATFVKSLPCTLADLDLAVSTGRVVDFRARKHLRDDPGDGSVPLIHPAHLRNGRISWPRVGGKKANALAANAETEALLMANGHYPVVKRFSSKEERRRVVASLSSPEDVPGQWVAFENHTNVFHHRNKGLDPLMAAGLVVWLNSTVVDDYFRLFSGHTQVNATDLRKLRYPDAVILKALGAAAGDGRLTQAETDALVVEVLR